MLSFVQSWFPEGANPVGVDFGAECLRLAQVERAGAEYRLIAAASAQIPPDIRNDPAVRLTFFARTLRDLWTDGHFRGRQAMLALPAAILHIQHLRLPKMDDASLKKSLPWEMQGKLPIDPTTALIRHLVAGDVYHEQEPRHEVIVFAAARQSIDQLLAAADMARLNVVGLMVGPQAMMGCLNEVYRRKNDSDITNCILDIGSTASRVIIVRGGHLLFARNLPVGGASTSSQSGVDQAISDSSLRMIEELEICRRYHDATFPDRPVQRLIFVGGAARQRDACEQIARGLGLAALIGDPLMRMGRTTKIGIESGIDRRLPQPAWAVAIGLSMGYAERNTKCA